MVPWWWRWWFLDGGRGGAMVVDVVVPRWWTWWCHGGGRSDNDVTDIQPQLQLCVGVSVHSAAAFSLTCRSVLIKRLRLDASGFSDLADFTLRSFIYLSH